MQSSPKISCLRHDRLFAKFKEPSPMFYECECGKKYNAFPALYLHFQRKHKMKISKNFQIERCIIRDHPTYHQIIYFFSQGAQLIEFNRLIKGQWAKVINKYVSEKVQRCCFNNLQLECFEKLKNFIGKVNLDIFEARRNPEKEELSYHFNQFILLQLEGLCPEKYNQWCEALQIFSDWQYMNFFSKIRIEKNNDFGKM